MISAFMILTLLLITTGCDNEGIVGEGLNPTGERVVTTTYDVDSIEIVNDNGFAGRLSNSAMGIVEDPVYGTITSAALLKPSINVENLNELPDDYNVKLTVELNPLKYGNENSISDYNIYEVNQRWRGREITYNQSISYDDSNLLGSFQHTDETAVEIDLDQEWTSRYRDFFNSTSSQRDSLYRFEFPGIVVVPVNQNQKIDFLRHQPSTNDTTETRVTRFVVENEQDSLIANIPLLDFGTSMERTNIPESDGLVLHNTLENILKVNLDIDAAQFESKEIVNAQLVFTIDSGPEETAPGGFLRPQPDLIRAHFFGSEPLDIASEIFARAASAGANLSENEQQFKINVTSYFVDRLFGETVTTPLYFSLQGNNGLFYSTTLHGADAPENLRPRLVITTINPEN
ncbi:hypothetical protein BH23BAC3_BH23BAC3_00260 [soil metagenome]